MNARHYRRVRNVPHHVLDLVKESRALKKSRGLARHHQRRLDAIGLVDARKNVVHIVPHVAVDLLGLTSNLHLEAGMRRDHVAAFAGMNRADRDWSRLCSQATLQRPLARYHRQVASRG